MKRRRNVCVCVGGGKWHRRWKVNWIVPPEADKLLSVDCCWPPEMAVNSCLILPPQLPFFFSFRFSFSHLLSSSLFPFLFVHPPSPLCTPACLFMCWEGCDWGVGGGVVTGVWPETTIPYTLALMLTNSSMHENTQKCVHTQHTYDPHVHLLPSRGWFTGMSVCVSEQGNKGVTIWTKRKGLCVCMRGCEGRLCTSVCVCESVSGCVLGLLQQSSPFEQSDWQTQTCLSLFVSFWTAFLWASFPPLIHYCTAANLGASVKD